MTPKEKAKELYDKMYSINEDDFISEYVSKAAALIAVNLVLSLNDIDSEYLYYLEVKQEIEKL
jgi:hypothetical protein